jgi:rRNA maturation endonuclease Nob1
VVNLVSEFIALIVKKEPIEAMKEVNKVIGKKGKYKNLTQKDIDKIVADTEDHIFQRDPDNLYVDDKDLTKSQLIEKEGRKYDLENIEGSADDMSVEDSLTTMKV